MKQFRSPLLAAMPQVDTRGRGKRMRTRMRTAAPIAFVVLLLIVAVMFELLPKDGSGYPLYWLHDKVYLPIKGYTYTLFYPTSFIWWGFITTILGLSLASWLSDRSFIRQSHIGLARFAINRKLLRPILLRTAGWFKQRGVEPRLLKSVAQHERALALMKLAATDKRNAKASRAECAKVAHLTQLLIKLLILPEATLTDHLTAATYWQQALLQIQVHGHEPPPSELASQIGLLMRPIFDEQDDNQLERALAQQANFEPSSIMIDLLYLAYFTDLERNTGKSKVKKALNSDTTATLERERNRWQANLADSIETRRTLLDEMRSQLEPRQLSRPDSNELERTLVKLAMPTEKDHLPAIGQLSLGIALHLAWQTKSPNIAQGYLDSIDTLAFVLQFVGPTSRIPEQTAILSALIGDLPSPEAYQLCAKLVENHLAQRQKEWQQALPSQDGPIKASDFDLAWTQVASLHHAAGPDAGD